LTATGATSVRKTSTFRIPNGHTRPRKLFALVAEAIGRVAFRQKMDCWAARAAHRGRTRAPCCRAAAPARESGVQKKRSRPKAAS